MDHFSIWFNKTDDRLDPRSFRSMKHCYNWTPPPLPPLMWFASILDRVFFPQLSGPLYSSRVLAGKYILLTPIHSHDKNTNLVVFGNLQKKSKLLYHESNLLDVGLVLQKARKQGTVLLQWRFDRILQQIVLKFANKETDYRTVCCRILTNPTVTLLYTRLFGLHSSHHLSQAVEIFNSFAPADAVNVEAIEAM